MNIKHWKYKLPNGWTLVILINSTSRPLCTNIPTKLVVSHKACWERFFHNIGG